MSINRRQPLLYFLLLLLLLQRSTHVRAGWMASGTLLYGGEQNYGDAGDGDLSYYEAAAEEDDAPELERAHMRMALPVSGSGSRTDAAGNGRADWEAPVDNELLNSATFIAHALLAGSGEEAGVLGPGEQYELINDAMANVAASRRRDSSEALRRDEVALRCKPNSPEEQARVDAAVKNTQDTIEHVTTLIRTMREHAVAIIKDISELEADFLGSCSDGGNSNSNNNNNNSNKVASNNSASNNNNCNTPNNNNNNNNTSSNNGTNNSNINGNANCMPTGENYNNNGSNMTQSNDRPNSYSSNRNSNCNPSGGNNNNGNCADNFANGRLLNDESAERFGNNNLNKNGNYENNNNNYILRNRILNENFNGNDFESENNNPNGFIGDLNNNNNNNMNTEGRRPQWNANVNTNANTNSNANNNANANNNNNKNNNNNNNNKNYNNNNNNNMNNNNNAGSQPRVIVSEFSAPVRTDYVGLPNQLREHAQYAVRSWKNQIEECKRLLDAAVQQSEQRERENAESDADGMRKYIKLVHTPQGNWLNGPEIAPSAAASLTPMNHHDHHKMNHNNNNDQNNNNMANAASNRKSNDDDKGKKKGKLSGGAQGESSKSSSSENDEGKNKGDKNSEKGTDETDKRPKQKRKFSGIYDVLRGVVL